MDIRPTEPQAQFLSLQCKYPLFVAGYGSGKSFTLIVSALQDLFSHQEARVAIYSDTFDQLRLNIIPRVEEMLQEEGVKYSLNKSEYTISIPGTAQLLIFRSVDNPKRIIGYEVFRSHVDELEATGNEAKANEVWRKIIARNRQKFGGMKNRVSVYTTPDQGFGFTYKKWGQAKPGSEYQFVRASTHSNIYAPDDYVKSLEDDYPAELVQAFINGEWCNITSGSVYKFDRNRNITESIVQRGEPLHIGMDFNVRNMAAVVTNGVGEAIDEFIGYLDTPAIIEAIKTRYPRHNITVYPDASGGNASSKGASLTDVSMLRAAGFNVRVGTHNPPVKDRINIVNKRLETNQLRINPRTCPSLVESLEKQAYNRNGEPDKESGFDHANDALGYVMAWRFPMRHERGAAIWVK